ncbi:hypothetical protein [Novipirellula artificiosorum]|uniref:Beta-galactosidase n=1 Tax=Novipirellula artificiosorum TaxID=2528016 RepID=A0A5C6D2L7_9BACT|nr:hypothetical protein [Novipirellula artificiosorum]TWU31182.1 hypothetical protein Poly41_63730 [Novipirellula artificiosorum]
MGLYLAGGGGLDYQPSVETWPLSVADIVYFRPTWNKLEEDGHGKGFEAYFEPIFDFWVRRRGKRVAFRVMSASTHARSAYATPKWVFDKGAASVEHLNLYGQTQTDPVFWDEKYLDEYCQFVRRLGGFLDGRKGLEYVDIGGIGEWGEMHLGLHMPGRWTQEQMDKAQFTRDRYIAAYRRAIDAHASAFPQTRM